MLASFGHLPSPLMLTTRFCPVSYIRIGATPPKLVLPGSTTLMAMPAATPASVALPPSS